MMKKNGKRRCRRLFSLGLLAFFLAACDMTYIENPGSGTGLRTVELSSADRDLYEMTGHFLKFTNMPSHAIAENIHSVHISNQVSAVASVDTNSPVRIFKDENSSIVYVPLAKSGGAPFADYGRFLASFTIHVDAEISFVVSADDNILVPFIAGRGEFDILKLGGDPLEEKERRYLTIYNLPLNLQPTNVSGVFIYNQAGQIAHCEDFSLLLISADETGASLKIPLVYSASSAMFAETGKYFIAFDLNIDAVTRYRAAETDRILANFTNGSGVFDINSMPREASDHRYLTFYNLPPAVQASNISNVYIHNQLGALAECEGVPAIIIAPGTASSTAHVPLIYSASGNVFNETGRYIVSFDINVDAFIRYRVTADDQLAVLFTNGSGVFDISSLPEAPPVPYLSLINLPQYATKNSFSSVSVYDMNGQVAEYDSSQSIIVRRNPGESSAAAMIPLSNYGSSGPFSGSGIFIISFTATIDAASQIIIRRQDNISAEFASGSAEYDMAENFGFFSGGLTEATGSGTAPPVIKSGTRWEMNGGFYQVSSDTAVPAHSYANTCLLYIYAAPRAGGSDFEYSTTPPVYYPSKKGYYLGAKRALYKLVFIRDQDNQYVAKTFINDNFIQFDKYAVANHAIGHTSAQQFYSLPGGSSQNAAAQTLPSGGYVFACTGAGGGGSGSIAHFNSQIVVAGLPGGSGGYVAELVLLNSDTDFSFFTGPGGGGIGTISNSISSGGGGGGSGSAVYSPAGYLLAAGGGGGAGGGSFNLILALTQAGVGLSGAGGGGGAGGAVGPGAQGGNSGNYRYEYYSITAPLPIPNNPSETSTSPSSPGAVGGGTGAGAVEADLFLFGGTGGAENAWEREYTSGTTKIKQRAMTSQGSSGGPAGCISRNAPYDWQNTNGANGQGGSGADSLEAGASTGAAGGNGGNNRNSARGGGSAGGSGGGGDSGGPGSIVIYKIF